MWTQFKIVFPTKSSHMSKRYKLVQKLESQTEEIFPSGRPPLPRYPPESGPETRMRREEHLRRLHGRSRIARGRHLIEADRGRRLLALEVNVEMHGAPPHAPGTPGDARSAWLQRVTLYWRAGARGGGVSAVEEMQIRLGRNF
jgi:hypothetical protein